MNVRPSDCGPFAVVLFLSLFTTGCAAVSGTGASSLVFQSYDLPGTLDSNVVIHAVERSFAHTLMAPPRITEGSVPSPLPTMPANFRVEQRRMYLDRLGVVSIPHVVCPQSMAILHGFVADAPDYPGLHSYTGCIQLYAGGYRVHIVDNMMMVSGNQDVPTPPKGIKQNSAVDLVSRVAQTLVEEVSEARLVPISDTQGLATSLLQVPPMVSEDLAPSSEQTESSIPVLLKEPAISRREPQEKGAMSSFPLVCLAPRGGVATVRSQPGGGTVVGTLQPGSVVAVGEPVDSTYVHVEEGGGPIGWVTLSEVKRLPCPIG